MKNKPAWSHKGRPPALATGQQTIIALHARPAVTVAGSHAQRVTLSMTWLRQRSLVLRFLGFPPVKKAGVALVVVVWVCVGGWGGERGRMVVGVGGSVCVWGGGGGWMAVCVCVCVCVRVSERVSEYVCVCVCV